MPDRTLSVAAYAAGASLAAITLVYVFGPTYFLDTDPSAHPAGKLTSRKKGVVGLSNPANDCFVNSVLQALAGLGDLRIYLIREVHRRSLDDDAVYSLPPPASSLTTEQSDLGFRRFAVDTPDWKLEGLQRGTVTKHLKDILDALNERPIYRKTISAAPFLGALENAFRQRISRQQQDAQEFLQVVAERLCDEYHAGRRARCFARRAASLDDETISTRATTAGDVNTGSQPSTSAGQREVLTPDQIHGTESAGVEGKCSSTWEQEKDEEGFPLEGMFESQIECLTCGFKPRPSRSTFCTLTLNVPQVSSTTLGACFDGLFKTEYIEDFKCEKCRLLHALALLQSERRRSPTGASSLRIQAAVEKLQLAIDSDPETPPDDVQLPDMRVAPKCKIARHIRLTSFPKVLAIHLSRSIFDAGRSSQKNSAKVSFPEDLPLGRLLQQRRYKLLGVVTHKGSHHSGHYETFRRQSVCRPFSNPSTFQPARAYSRTASPAPTPGAEASSQAQGGAKAPTPAQQRVLADESNGFPFTPATPVGSSRDGPGGSVGSEESSGAESGLGLAPAVGTNGLGTAGQETTQVSSSPSSSSGTARLSLNLGTRATLPIPARPHSTPAATSKRWRQQERWWRISDDKVKEASTRDVLSMQREVYLLFYELDNLS
ncbi:hypothetical protein C8A05DRAFT_18433 [Staphylotrichum tortipilum]|uniref:Ubiquitin carboxyl-terminal hydrolase n=1 Tax=Staphylotrichum tortipilum TaxID=2831512 RepID=A0AAN6MFD7_9PEZI|nr:hypothetical protein C8A05DRAFT_18433 [Staphylotrichum longicolle]